jgi:TatD DNase family protein
MIDTHCHLDFENYDGDRDSVIQASVDGGVAKMINIGIDNKTSIASLKLAEEYEFIFASVGYHPHSANEFNKKSQDELERLAQHPKAVAIGEIGLDYYRNYSPREDQINAFRRQIRLAVEMELPIVVHIREAMEESMKILEQEQAYKCGGVLHCFPGTYDESQQAMDMNLMVAFGGTLTYNNSKAAITSEKVPLKQILMETDAPFLTPVPFRGKRNSPLFVQYSYRKLAEIKQMDLADIEKKIDKNAIKLFNLA